MDDLIPLPPSKIRQGSGPLRLDDDHFVETGQADVAFLQSVGLKPGASMIDLGCGPGRLAVGLISSGWSGSYLGIEVNRRHVAWAERELTPRFPDYRFVNVDASNARYNPNGADDRRLPVEQASVDFICAFSVFSHMIGEETRAYFAEFRRVLSDSGRAYVTAYVADDVPDETENPSWMREWNGPLHCVLYSTDHMRDLVRESGLVLEEIIRRPDRAQTGLLLTTT